MDPIKTENTNAEAAPPPHLEGQVVTVPCEMYPQPGGNVLVLSVWDFTEAEREEIAQGAQVKLALNVARMDVVPLQDMRVVIEPALVEETPGADGSDADGADEPERPPTTVTKLHLPGRDF